jgi:hypothetical protein
MNPLGYFPVLCILSFALFLEAKPLSDSLPILDHFSQAGNSVSRFKVERFLLKQDSSVEFVDYSLGYKWSGHAVGAMLWCVNFGISAYELKQVLDAVSRQNVLLDSTGKQVALSNSLYKFTIPLTIGSEVASFVQSLLYNRSDFLLHKGARAYNAALARKTKGSPGLDLHIETMRNGWYKQAGLLMEEPVLLGVLREQPSSRPFAYWSRASKEIGIQTGSWAGMYIGLAVLSYLWEASGDTSFIIDKRARDSNLRIGVSLAVFAIANAIVSSVTKNAGIKKYNAALPRPPAMPAVRARGPDSTKTGIFEGPPETPVKAPLDEPAKPPAASSPAGAPAETPAQVPPDTTRPKKEIIGW